MQKTLTLLILTMFIRMIFETVINNNYDTTVIAPYTHSDNNILFGEDRGKKFENQTLIKKRNAYKSERTKTIA